MEQSNTPPPSPTQKVQKVNKQPPQGMQLLPLLIKFFKTMGILLTVWIIGYFGFSTAWVMIGLFVYLANEEYRKVKDSKRAFAREAAVNERQAILARVEELPSWVYFPDVERAEWLNKMIKQMWPYVGDYMKNLLTKTVEPQVQNSLPKSLTPFKFEKIDLGDIPPRIGGVKVYTDRVKRDEIIMDLEIFYMSDANINISVRGISAGIKELMVHGTLRIQMKPLVRSIPIIGGLSIFFLNPPSVDFDFTNTANILDLPVLSNTLRTVVEDQIAFYMVLPNKIPISLSNQVSVASLKFPTPQGVLQLHFMAGKELAGKDKTLMGKKTSDPYCKIFVGANTFKTKIVKGSVNPVWNQYFEAAVEEKHGQVVDIDVFDDDTGEDDELGSTSLDIQSIAEQGSIDTWLPLEGVKTGMLHVRALWLHLSKNPDDLEKSLARNADVRAQTGSEEHLASALLLVTVDSAKDLPSKAKRSKKSMSEPSPMVKVTVANKTLQSNVQSSTTNPLWEHNFEFLIHNPTLQELVLEVVDTKKNGKSLGNFTYALKTLLTAKDMTVSRPFRLNDSSTDATVSIRLCLRILTSQMPADWALDTGEVETLETQEPDTQTDTQQDTQQTQQPAPQAAPAKPDTTGAVSDGTSVDSMALPATPQGDQATAVEELIVSGKATVTQSGTPGTEMRQRTAAPSSTSEQGLGKMRLTVRYSAQRNKLVLAVHNCVNLLPVEGDSDGLADPYLRIYVLPERSSSTKRKTEVVKNNLSPIFDETFEWSMTLSEAQSKTLEISVKNDVGMFSKTRTYMGVVLVELSEYDLTKAFTDWFPLEECDEK